MEQHPNPLLRAGCFLFIFGGILSCLVSIITYLRTADSMLNVDDATRQYIDQAALEQSGGAMDGEVVMGFLSGIIFVLCGIAVAILIVNLIVGILGLSRCRRPEKYRFFKVWGIILLVIGVLGTLMGGISTPPALVGLLCGVVAPVLFIIGAQQQKKILMTSGS